MRSKTSVFMAMLAVSVSLTFAPRVAAQMTMSAPELRGVFKPVVGEGAGYEFVKTDGQKMHFDIAIVDKDPGGGYWTEYSIADPHSKGTMYMKMMVSQRADDVVVEHMIMQIPGQPPMDMSSMMQGMAGMAHAKQSQKIDIRSEGQNLPRRAGVSKEAIKMASGLLTKGRYIVSAPDPAVAGTKLVRLTPKGRDARDAYLRRLGEVEERWGERFGKDHIRNLRESLERLVGDGTAERSPLFLGLTPPADGWRASAPKPETLPHFPMVLHRGGYPDGS